jgi:hypothetical protein
MNELCSVFMHIRTSTTVHSAKVNENVIVMRVMTLRVNWRPTGSTRACGNLVLDFDYRVTKGFRDFPQCFQPNGRIFSPLCRDRFLPNAFHQTSYQSTTYWQRRNMYVYVHTEKENLIAYLKYKHHIVRLEVSRNCHKDEGQSESNALFFPKNTLFILQLCYPHSG